MGCNCGGSGAKRQRGSGPGGGMRQQPGFWAPATKPAPAAEKTKTE